MAGQGSEDQGGRRRGGFVRAGDDVPAILAGAFRKRGFAQQDIVLRWPEIVGPVMADQCRPERLQWPRRSDPKSGDAPADTPVRSSARSAGLTEGAILHLTVSPGWATEIQHLEPQLIERVNRFFGWRAVTGIRLRQAPVRSWRKPVPKPPRALKPAESAAIEQAVAGITDSHLRDVLTRLGTAVFTRES